MENAELTPFEELKEVFADFHTGKYTKTVLAMAIGLWQERDKPLTPPTIDRVEEFWKRYEEHFAQKARSVIHKVEKGFLGGLFNVFRG